METRVLSATHEVIIGGGRPTVLIGERINPTGKKRLAEALRAGDLLGRRRGSPGPGGGRGRHPRRERRRHRCRRDRHAAPRRRRPWPRWSTCRSASTAARSRLWPPLWPSARAVRSSTRSPAKRPRSRRSCRWSRSTALPVIGLTLDEKGIPAEAAARVEIAHRIVERAEAIGIPREDVIIDCLTLSLGANVKAGLATLEATRRVRDELGVNQTQGCSNISHGLPNRPVLTGAYLALAIEAGLTCPTVDVALVRLAILSADLVLGRDNYAMRFIAAFREAQKAAAQLERRTRRSDRGALRMRRKAIARELAGSRLRRVFESNALGRNSVFRPNRIAMATRLDDREDVAWQEQRSVAA